MLQVSSLVSKFQSEATRMESGQTRVPKKFVRAKDFSVLLAHFSSETSTKPSDSELSRARVSTRRLDYPSALPEGGATSTSDESNTEAVCLKLVDDHEAQKKKTELSQTDTSDVIRQELVSLNPPKSGDEGRGKRVGTLDFESDLKLREKVGGATKLYRPSGIMDRLNQLRGSQQHWRVEGKNAETFTVTGKESKTGSTFSIIVTSSTPIRTPINSTRVEVATVVEQSVEVPTMANDLAAFSTTAMGTEKEGAVHPESDIRLRRSMPRTRPRHRRLAQTRKPKQMVSLEVEPKRTKRSPLRY